MRNGFIEIILQRNSVTENRSDTKTLLQPTGLKDNLGRGIYPPTTVSLSFLKRVMSPVWGQWSSLTCQTSFTKCRYPQFCSLVVSLKSLCKWSTVQAKQKILAKYPRLMLTMAGKDGEGLEKNRLNCLKNSCKKEEIEEGKRSRKTFPLLVDH